MSSNILLFNQHASPTVFLIQTKPVCEADAVPSRDFDYRSVEQQGRLALLGPVELFGGARGATTPALDNVHGDFDATRRNGDAI